MLEQTPSRTAQGTAFARALHLYIDDKPPIFDDYIAFELLPVTQRRYIRRLAVLSRFWLRQYRQRYSAFTAMRGHLTVRARYTEDTLAAARQQGVNRLIVLGAGLDTFALRQQAPTIDVVEIDHPATQGWKQNLLKQRKIELPPELTFLPIDFEKTALNDVWIDNASPDFISWLGVTYYLTREAIAGTLKTLAECTQSGSQLVLDYWQDAPPMSLSSPLLRGAQFAVALQGEPMRSFFRPQDIEQLAIECGWQVQENCNPSPCASRRPTSMPPDPTPPTSRCRSRRSAPTATCRRAGASTTPQTAPTRATTTAASRCAAASTPGPSISSPAPPPPRTSTPASTVRAVTATGSCPAR
ncbi:MAG: SAM-dependent methyltransferase, partial [Pseudomonadota bacterium]